MDRARIAELRYRRAFVEGDARLLRVLLCIAIPHTLLAAHADVRQHGLPPWILAIVVGKVFIVAGFAAALVLLRGAASPRKYDQAAAITYAGIAVGLLLTVPPRWLAGEVIAPMASCALVVAAMYFGMRGPLRPRAAVAIVVTLGWLLILTTPHAHLASVALTMSVMSIFGLNLVAAMSAREFEAQRRASFEAQRALAARLRELAVAKEAAEESSRARTRFLASMSHEFRTPMNAVIGLSELLLDAPNPAQADELRTIRDNARSLLRLLEDVLDFAKIDAGRLTLSPVVFDLHVLAASALGLFRAPADARKLQLALVLEPDVPRGVFGDDARLRQVLVNLLGNAIKFTEQGAVRLHVGAAPEGRVSFRVEDSGIGIDPQALERLFTPFEQADEGIGRRFGGTGLGLSISRQIVRTMGGEIAVESAPGEGSTFSFTIPLPAQALSVRVPTARPATAGLSCLVVDDTPINRAVAGAMLERLGCAVELACDGEDSIAKVTLKPYDVIFMDVQMPGMSGLEATAEVKKLAPRARVVAMTASVYEEDRQACRSAGMHEFLGKPIDRTELEALIERLRGELFPTAARGG